MPSFLGLLIRKLLCEAQWKLSHIYKTSHFTKASCLSFSCDFWATVYECDEEKHHFFINVAAMTQLFMSFSKEIVRMEALGSWQILRMGVKEPGKCPCTESSQII